MGQPAQGEGGGRGGGEERGNSVWALASPGSHPCPAPPALSQLFLYNLAANFAQGLVVFFAFVLGLEKTPLTPIQVRH